MVEWIVVIFFFALSIKCNWASSVLKSAPEMMTPNQMKLEGKNQEIAVIDDIE